MSATLAWRAALLSPLLLPLAGQARDGVRVPSNPLYQQECAACHVAYPPGALPAASWRRLMQNLPNHFGTDASLDPAAVRQLSAWLDQYAATGRRAQQAPPDDRITRSAWFQRKHDEIAPRTWQLPKVKSPANCAACHTQAPQGVFDEHDVHIPR
ncbi:cytochrome C [Massilia arenosa]|uniref:Cytochrome C n=1 Tax=Zemynaea arenosa TaxID=2561931 RepID=A0A4Y9SNK8_9BURK|nr:diheme cytochrome c [Massilia arenosa]TFW28158.1 cytochrome C [Massilia arenosa]